MLLGHGAHHAVRAGGGALEGSSKGAHRADGASRPLFKRTAQRSTDLYGYRVAKRTAAAACSSGSDSDASLSFSGTCTSAVFLPAAPTPAPVSAGEQISATLLCVARKATTWKGGGGATVKRRVTERRAGGGRARNDEEEEEGGVKGRRDA